MAIVRREMLTKQQVEFNIKKHLSIFSIAFGIDRGELINAVTALVMKKQCNTVPCIRALFDKVKEGKDIDYRNFEHVIEDLSYDMIPKEITFNEVDVAMQRKIQDLSYDMYIFLKHSVISKYNHGLRILGYRPSVSIVPGKKEAIKDALGIEIYWDDGKPKKVHNRSYTDEQIDALLNRVGQRSNSVPTDALNMEKWD